jgi:5S rRNA maturation endonuclease (ribonuclease M5)
MRGNLLQLITLLTDKTDGEARRMIKKLPDVPLSDLLDKALVEDKVHEIPQMVVDGFIDQLNQRAIDYLSGRGFDKETIEYFEVGYDSDNDFIVVPIRNHKQQIVGLNGRSIEGKRFKISKKTHRNKILFNINNAKKYGTAIVCESQFDVMRLHQAGFPNGICPMGSHVSDDQFHMMSRYFTRVIIATDADAAGRSMGMKISNKLHHRVIEWAVDDVNKRSIYPNKAKDIGDLTDSEIQKVIQNSVTDWEYRLSGMV